MKEQIIRAGKREIKLIEDMFINGEIDDKERDRLVLKIEKEIDREIKEEAPDDLYSPYSY